MTAINSLLEDDNIVFEEHPLLSETADKIKEKILENILMQKAYVKLLDVI